MTVAQLIARLEDFPPNSIAMGVPDDYNGKPFEIHDVSTGPNQTVLLV